VTVAGDAAEQYNSLLDVEEVTTLMLNPGDVVLQQDR